MSFGRWNTAHAVHVRIEELRLEGFDPRDRYRIADALERELVRLFTRTDHPAFGTSAETERLDAGGITFGEGDRPHRIGEAIARATFASITRERGR